MPLVHLYLTGPDPLKTGRNFKEHSGMMPKPSQCAITKVSYCPIQSLSFFPVIPTAWFNRPAPEVAVDLIGCTLVRNIEGEIVRGQIVETEAYEAGDPAMHAYRNKTARNEVVFGPAGVAYIYRIYRQYHCFNIVTDRAGLASTILIRAITLEKCPSWIDPNKEKLARVGAGPGKLCRTLQLDESLRGVTVQPASGLWVEGRNTAVEQKIADQTMTITQTTRIGLSKGVDIPWRWYLAESPSVSRR